MGRQHAYSLAGSSGASTPDYSCPGAIYPLEMEVGVSKQMWDLNMKRKEGNIGGYLYSKTKEHPAKRYSIYWDIPEFLLIYAYNDVFMDGKAVFQALIRLNSTLSLIGKEVSRDRFNNFMEAGKKYNYWQIKRLSKKQQSTLTLSKEARENADF